MVNGELIFYHLEIMVLFLLLPYTNDNCKIKSYFFIANQNRNRPQFSW